jgi:hypothetical protein
MHNPKDPILRSVDGDLYSLSEPYSVDFALWIKNLEFTIPEGFETDIASVPSVLRCVMDRASLGLVAPLVHDYLCDRRGRLIAQSGDLLSIHWFDVSLLFLMLLRMDGISWPRSLAAFLAVVLGGPKWPLTNPSRLSHSGYVATKKGQSDDYSRIRQYHLRGISM